MRFRAGSVGVRTEMVICFVSVLIPLSFTLGSSLSSRLSWLMIVVNGPGVCFGMIACLVLVLLAKGILGLLLLVTLRIGRCLGAYPSDDSAFWTPPDFWDAGESGPGN